MNHYMLDLETLGGGHNGAIVAIGVCAFDPAQGRLEQDQEFWKDRLDTCGLLLSCGLSNPLMAPNFYRRIDLTRSQYPGTIDPATVEFWLAQDDAARQELVGEGRVPLENALTSLNTWLSQRGVWDSVEDDSVRLWSKPPLFDERLLRDAYTRHGWIFPWHWRASRDMRTLIEVAHELGIKDLAPDPALRHHALADAQHQARVVCAIVQEMRKRK